MTNATPQRNAAGKILAAIARLLLGLIFFVFGSNGFLHFIPPPPASSIPADAGAFMTVMMHSHYFTFTSGAQVLAGALLLLDQYVPLALILLAAIIANILTFHITMMPSTLFPMPIFVTVLWFLTAWPLREHFAPLLARKT